MKLRLLTAWVAFVSLSNTALANDYNKYIKELGGLATGAEKSLATPEQYTPKYTDNPPNTDAYYGGGSQIPKAFGEQKLSDCKNIAETDLYLRQECEGVNLVTQGKTQRPEVSLSPNEKLVDHTKNISGDPKDTLDKYQWKYPINPDGSIGEIPTEVCYDETVVVEQIKTEKICSEYVGSEAFLCEAILNVTVDPNFNYSCLETKYQNSKNTCTKKLTVKCETKPDCTTAGIKVGSTEGDMNVSFKKVGNNHQLIFGTIGDDYWGAGQYDRQFTFDLVGKDRLNLFKLSRVKYDDWLVVVVNGAIVFSDSPGKMIELKRVCGSWSKEEKKCVKWSGKNQTICSKWEIIPPKCTGFYNNRVVIEGTENAIGWPERSTSWDKAQNVDLRPYLKEGKNQIKTRTIVGGRGESAAIFDVLQYCTPTCLESWDNQCKQYEDRVGK